jgi:glucokinase
VPLRKEVRRRAFRSAVEACRILPAALPETAGVIGAAGVFKKETFGVV